MRIVISKSFGTYRRGQQFDWQPAFARIMIARGLIEPLETIPEVETAEIKPEVRTATQKTQKRRRQQ